MRSSSAAAAACELELELAFTLALSRPIRAASSGSAVAGPSFVRTRWSLVMSR